MFIILEILIVLPIISVKIENYTNEFENLFSVSIHPRIVLNE